MELEELIEGVEALTHLCMTQQAVIASLEAKLDAVIGALPARELELLREQLLQRSSVGHAETPDETRSVYQQRIATTLQGIDMLLRR